MENKFNENDKEMFIKFLNYVYKNAEFNEVKLQDMTEAIKLLNHMQTEILPKIDANILEVVAIHEAEESKE